MLTLWPMPVWSGMWAKTVLNPRRKVLITLFHSFLIFPSIELKNCIPSTVQQRCGDWASLYWWNWRIGSFDYSLLVHILPHRPSASLNEATTHSDVKSLDLIIPILICQFYHCQVSKWINIFFILGGLAG